MCGINGVIGEPDRIQAESWISTMNNSMAHRGPDSAGCWSIEGVAFGHRRLSIIDTSDAGNQPFLMDGGNLVIAFNGEVYNYVELREQLQAEYTFESETDTEVILAAYQKWGIQAVQRFIGMFAFALWDKRKGKGFLVRDRLGIKPLYYSRTGGKILFASEVRSLLATGLVERRISRSGLVDYLRYQTVHSPETILESVSMLPAGHIMEFDTSSNEIREFWSPLDTAELNPSGSRKDMLARTSALLQSAVEIRMRADVPFGAFLSGGIDSSIIVGLMARSTNHPVDTFSITFHEKEWDESVYSGMIAKRFNTRHHPIRLAASDFLDLVPDALDAMDHPSGDGPNTFVVSKVTRAQGVKMALSGLGGDEVFAGYDVFRRMKQMEAKSWLTHTPRFLRVMSAKALSAMKPSVASEKIAAVLSEQETGFRTAYPYSRRVFLDERIQDLLAFSVDARNVVTEITNRAASSSIPLLSKVSVVEMTTYMQNVLLRDADQMSMAHALEIRVPFLDHRLIQYVLGVPDDIKFPHTPKQFLTDAVGDLIPPEIIHRPKMGFTFPWELWMKNELRTMCETNLRYLGETGHFKPGAVMLLWDRFIGSDRRVTWSRIWPLVVLGHWMRTHDLS